MSQKIAIEGATIVRSGASMQEAASGLATIKAMKIYQDSVPSAEYVRKCDDNVLISESNSRILGFKISICFTQFNK